MNVEQRDLFSIPDCDPLSDLIDDKGKPAAIVVGCSRTKSGATTTARRMYVSERFQNACEIAEALSAPLYVLSGLHGLLLPDQTISPYDFNLDASDAEHRQVWRSNVAAALRRELDSRSICILATDSYAQELQEIALNRRSSSEVRAPLQALEPSIRPEWYKQALAVAMRYRDLKLLYQMISVARSTGKTFRLSDLRNRKLPDRGVYIFVDLDEKNLLGERGRIVRVGTHAVSKDSRSTLKSRLRNHLGLADGSGNHRGSIFRLHVGRAMLERDGRASHFPHWGRGQHATNSIRELERPHEMSVSKYLSGLEVCILDINDMPGKDSLRATVERQLIALCTEALRPIDRSSDWWLGRSSPMPVIAKSGLWNVRDVGRKYEPASPGSVGDICALGIAS